MIRFLILSIVFVFVAGANFISGNAESVGPKSTSITNNHGKNNTTYINYLKCRFNYGCIGAGNGFDLETNRQPAQKRKKGTTGEDC